MGKICKKMQKVIILPSSRDRPRDKTLCFDSLGKKREAFFVFFCKQKHSFFTSGRRAAGAALDRRGATGVAWRARGAARAAVPPPAVCAVARAARM